MAQLSIFDYRADPRPLPLIVAEKWGFNLTYVDQDGNLDHYLYCVRDWYIGLGGTKSGWLQFQLGTETNPVIIITERPHRPPEPMQYVDAKGLYSISQRMYQKEGKSVSTIRDEVIDYLAASGVWVDQIRRDPEKREALAAIDRRRTIEIHERAGYGDHPAVQHLRDRDANIKSLNSLKYTISKICNEPKWGRLINQEYLSLFNETARALKNILNAKSVRDALPPEQIAALTLGERLLQRALSQQGRLTSEQIEPIIDQVMRPLGKTLREICESMGVDFVTGKSLLE